MGKCKERERIVSPECNSAPVSVLSDDHTILANLCITILLREVIAEIPSAVSVGGIVLPRCGGADNV
jgi:hypothetical protein